MDVITNRFNHYSETYFLWQLFLKNGRTKVSPPSGHPVVDTHFIGDREQFIARHPIAITVALGTLHAYVCVCVGVCVLSLIHI